MEPMVTLPKLTRLMNPYQVDDNAGMGLSWRSEYRTEAVLSWFCPFGLRDMVFGINREENSTE